MGAARVRDADGTAGVTPGPATVDAPHRNEVLLTGRLAAVAEERTLPSGDVITTFRVVVPRDPVTARSRPGVDTIDVVAWSASTRRVALRLSAGDTVEVEGALRRRFFGVPGGRASRYEVEARRLRRASGRRPAGT